MRGLSWFKVGWFFLTHGLPWWLTGLRHWLLTVSHHCPDLNRIWDAWENCQWDTIIMLLKGKSFVGFYWYFAVEYFRKEVYCLGNFIKIGKPLFGHCSNRWVNRLVECLFFLINQSRSIHPFQKITVTFQLEPIETYIEIWGPE